MAKWVIDDDGVIIQEGKSVKEKKEKKAKSGCYLHSRYGTDTTMKSGKVCKGLFISVWKVIDGVMYKGKIFRTKKMINDEPPFKGDKRNWVSVLCVLNAFGKQPIMMRGLLCLETHYVYFKEHNMVAKHDSKNGGYFGKHISKKYNK